MAQQATTIQKRSGRPLLDFAGAAEYTGLTERYMRRLTAEKRVPHIKLGPGRTGRIRFDPDQLDDWITTLNNDPAA